MTRINRLSNICSARRNRVVITYKMWCIRHYRLLVECFHNDRVNIVRELIEFIACIFDDLPT